jgi:ligand-binding sensor domain-containing protein/signal transduction histidine kinase
MWFGTKDGLNRFDGYTFRVYRHDPQDSQSPSHNYIMSIYEDPGGVLWIGTYGGGLDRFDPGTGLWRHYQHDPNDPDSLSHNNVRSVYQDRDGVLWIATHGGGLDRFDRETEQFTHYRPDPEDPFGLCDWLIDSVYEDREGRLWIGSNNEGLVRFDRSTGRFTYYRHDPDDPQSLSADLILAAILEDAEGMLWVGAFDGLNHFDPETGRAVRYHHDPDDPQTLSHNIVQALYQDRSGVLWVGTGGGLSRFDPQTGTFVRYRNDPGDPRSLSSNLVMSIYEDRAGALWIGTMGGGLNRVDRAVARFQAYTNDPRDPNSLSNNNVEAIWEDRAGMLWIGTSGGGLNRFDRTTGEWRHLRHDPDDPHSLGNDIVSSVLEDRSGRLWVGTAFGGLGRFDRASERFARYSPAPRDPDHSLSDSAIRALYEDHEGTLWVGMHGDGINVLDPETGQVTHYRHDPDDPYSLGNNWILTFYEDDERSLWIGTRDAGLDRFNRETGQFIHYRHDPSDPQSLGSGAVQAIHQDGSGVLWIGTDGGGLNKLDRERNTFARYSDRNGLPSNSVLGILEDDHGYLWLSTGNGLSRFDPQNETFRNYDARDGLENSVFIGGASFGSESGEMLFGGFNGVSAFYPERIEDNPYVPPIVLTALTQDGREIDVGVPAGFVDELTLHRPNSFFEFEYAALNYTQPGKNRYAYKLEGFDADWNDMGTRRFGSYGNLPAGEYTLRIIGSNNDGLWNEAGLSVQVTVVPQLWETWWFWGITALVLAVGVVGAYRLRVRSIEARSRRLEGLVEERTSQLEAFYLAEEKMHRHLRLDQVLQALVDVAVEVLRADKSAVYVWDGEREKWVMRVARGLSSKAMGGLTFAREEGSIGHAATTGEAVVVEDAVTDPIRETERPEAVQIALAEGIRSFMHLPIRVDGEILCIFSVSFSSPHAFGQGERRLFLALVQRAVLAIENARLYEQAQDLAALEERQRLARDLHDAVTQTLFSTSLIAEVLPRIWEQDPDDGHRRLEQVRQGTRSALAEMRTLLLELRPTGLADADLGDLVRQLGEAVTGRSRVSVTVDVDGGCDLPSNVQVALYRIAQEALNNVARHAQASRAWVSLHCSSAADGENRGKAVMLSIRDNGRGFDPDGVSPDHLGLGIMRERAEAVGAMLTIESAPERGTEVSVLWPANKEANTDE